MSTSVMNVRLRSICSVLIATALVLKEYQVKATIAANRAGGFAHFQLGGNIAEQGG